MTHNTSHRKSLWKRFLDLDHRLEQCIEVQYPRIGRMMHWIKQHWLLSGSSLFLLSMTIGSVIATRYEPQCTPLITAGWISGIALICSFCCIAVKIRATGQSRKFRNSLGCLCLTFFLSWMMVGSSPIESGASPTDGQVHTDQVVVKACGPLCLILVALVIIGVAAVIISGLLKICKNMNKPPKKPTNPDDTSASNGGTTSALGVQLTHIEGSYEGLPTITSATSEDGIIAYDITGSNQDGSTNDVFFDRTGVNRYCMMFVSGAESSTNMVNWQSECTVRGWVSFSPGYTISPSETQSGNTQIVGQPQNVLLVTYTNGIVASRLYYPAGGGEQAVVRIPPGTSPQKYFRLAAKPD